MYGYIYVIYIVKWFGFGLIWGYCVEIFGKFVLYSFLWFFFSLVNKWVLVNIMLGEMIL